MKALVLAGGRGVNMAPFSATRPNPMIPVAGVYLIDHTLSLLREAGVNLVNLVVGHRAGALKNHLGEDDASGVTINFIDQGRRQGIGAAILKARDKFTPGEHFLLVYADTLTTRNIFSVTLQSFGLRNEPTAAICLTESGEKYGNVYLGQEMKITRFIEKPKKQAGLGNYVLAGVFVLSTRFFDYLREAGGDMEAALRALIKKESLRAAIWENDWLDMAYPWDTLTANRRIMDQWQSADIHHSVELSETRVAVKVMVVPPKCTTSRVQIAARPPRYPLSQLVTTSTAEIASINIEALQQTLRKQ